MMMGNRQRTRLRLAVALACTIALVASSPLVFQGAATRAAAGGSVLSLSPSTGAYGVGQTFQVGIMLNTNGEAINAVQADLSFPADKLEVTSLDYTTGGFLALVLDHTYDNTTGRVRLGGGIWSPGFTGAAGRVATLTFRARAAGSAAVVFDATCAVLRNADNVNVLTGTLPAQFTITGGTVVPGGLVVAPPMLTCTEGGGAGSFAVALTSVPTATVTVSLASDPQVTVSPTGLTFAPAVWDVPQTVMVTAVDDSLVQGMRTVALQLAVDSVDPAYRGIAVAPVLVTIADNDVAPTGHTVTASVSGQGGTIAPSGSVAVEQGGSMRFVMTPSAGYEIDTVTVDGVAVSVWDRALMAYDFTGVTANRTISCTFRHTKDTTPPTLTLVGLDAAGTPRVVMSATPWKVAVQATDDRGPVTVKVAEGSTILAEAPANGDTVLSVTVPDGTHLLTVSATDAGANVTSRQVELVVDTTGPVISISQAPATTASASFVVTGRVTDAGSGVASLTVGGSAVQWSADGSFSSTTPLSKGPNSIRIEAVDKLGNKSAKTISVSYVPVVTVVLRIGDPFMTVGGLMVAIDSSGKVAPIIQNSRTLLPIRALIEALGGTVGWDPVARKATLALKGTTLQLWIGKATATVNGRAVPIDAADKRVVPVIAAGRTLLPLRFVSESLGLELVWDAALRSVTLNYAP
jgi:hypothetical protein